eukprot:TRINITY_DN2929_c0_g1_i1.p1 TRINITY_DN2929_c0_g1~~TRINITY_DN2929_c0_g1_i1.p1  ORF type:complete len:545 (+),score=95.01 TRINITY_DN2929_c0_g1_i1:86-1720(+)
MTYISVATGDGITFGLLGAFAVVGALAVPYSLRALKAQGQGLDSNKTADYWYSARDSQGWMSIALSICATSAGAWLLYTPGEAAYVGGWWAIIGYSVAIYLGPLIMCFLAPKFREQLPDSGNITDWVGWRFGRVTQGVVTLALVYYMFIYLVSQLKTMGDLVGMFYGRSPEWGIVPVALVTMLYTMIGGLPASIVTDWVQAVCIMVFVIVVIITLFTQVDITAADWAEVSKGSDAGFDAFVSLCFSIFGAEVFNLAFWQRLYAARDVKELRKGFIVGGGMISLLTFLFGVGGLLLKANDMRQQREGVGVPIMIPAFTFFEILDMPNTTQGIRILVFVLAVSMIASCADSFQTAITSIISREVIRWQLPSWKSLLLGELLVVIVNIPAMLFAIYAANDVGSDKPLAVKLTDLFGMADILTITLVVPLFSGLQPFVTTKGCLAGIFSGIFFVMAWGWIEFGTFMAGLEMLTLMCFSNSDVQPKGYSPYACGPWYAWRSAIMFSVCPLVTAIFTYGFSYLERTYEMLTKICTKLQIDADKEVGECVI